ncbi:MAG: PspA/IM30 family protein [Deltaproteobacteria bacterium]|nr:PspA/IM30 family protein [Myxococcales bacterium]MDP3221422.1 PspA/IM30 family protein [Deltaproteobacteria bacterium]
MGIFGRLASLIKSNLNDLISKSEDPEKMLNQVILEMNTQLGEAKKQVALSIADEKRLAKQFETERATAEEWERKAMMAVRAGDDGLAKEALLRQKEHESLSAEFERQWQKQKTAVEQLKTALKTLNNKIEEAKRKKNVLVARKKRAEAQKAIHETMQGLSNDSAFDTFNRMEEKIVQMEAEADAQTEVAEQYSGDALSQRFKDLEVSKGADMALDELKRKMGVAPPVAATAQGPTNVRVNTGAEEAAQVEASEEAELEAALTAAKARRQNG